MSLEKREHIGTYEVVERVAEGAFGVTYLVTGQDSSSTGARYLLKELRIDKVDDWKAVELFQREAKVLESLSHRGIPRYVGSVVEEGGATVAIVQEYLRGRTLQTIIDDHATLGEEQFLAYLRDGLDILAYLHGRVPKVVHRDITPRNIIVDDDHAYLVDFGAVKVALGTVMDGTSVGSFGFMAPEQVLGKANPGTDMYGLGMTFVSLATRLDPSALPMEDSGRRIDVRRACRALPAHVVEVLHAMTDPDPSLRMVDAKVALEALEHQRIPAAKAPPVPARPRRWPKVLKWGGLGILALFVVTFLGGWIYSLVPDEYEVARFGGWFTGHGNPISAYTGTIFDDWCLIECPDEATAVGFSPDGTLLASVDGEDVLVWDVASGSLVESIDLSGYEAWDSRKVSFDETGTSIRIVSYDYIVTVDVATGHPTRRVSITSSLDSLGSNVYGRQLDTVFLGDGTPVSLLDAEQTLYVVHPFDKKIVQTISLRNELKRLEAVLSPDGTKIYAVGPLLPGVPPAVRLENPGNPTISRLVVLDVATGERLQSLDITYDITTLVVSPDGDQLALGQYDTILVYDTAAWGDPSFLEAAVSGDLWSSMAFSADGTALVTKSWDEVLVLDVKTKNLRRVLAGHGGNTRNIAFSPDGSLLATVGRDMLVKLWDTGAP